MRFPYRCDYCGRYRQWLSAAACKAPPSPGFWLMCTDCTTKTGQAPKPPNLTDLGAYYTLPPRYKDRH